MPTTPRPRGAPGEDDILDTGGRPRVPRWMYAAGGLVAAVVVAGSVIAATHDSPRHTTRQASPTPTDSGDPIHPGPANSDDVLIVSRQLFRLTGGGLYRFELPRSGRPSEAGVLAVSGLAELEATGVYQLVGDATSHTVWIVGLGGAPTTVMSVDTRTLAVRSRIDFPRNVNAAAALGGHLYLATDNAVVDVTADGAPRDLGPLGGEYGSMAADPARRRVLLFDPRTRRAVAYTPSTGRVLGGAKLPFGKGFVTATGDGQVWAGGYRAQAGGGAVLVHLDARTLRPAGTSPLVDNLGPGARLVGVGQHVIWVRSGGGGDGLWCVDDATGQAAQHWDVAGRVVSTGGRAELVAFAGDGHSELGPLALHGCRG